MSVHDDQLDVAKGSTDSDKQGAQRPQGGDGKNERGGGGDATCDISERSSKVPDGDVGRFPGLPFT